MLLVLKLGLHPDPTSRLELSPLAHGNLLSAPHCPVSGAVGGPGGVGSQEVRPGPSPQLLHPGPAPGKSPKGVPSPPENQ